ncbi:MAG: LamB/YcsF family protein [Chloroflexota bacterium]
MRIDLNADVGESFGAWRIGEDERLIPLVTSINVACGFHAGDPLVIERTVRLGIDAGVAIGAHPGYADLAGFGRRDVEMPLDELEASIVYQVAAVAGFAAAAGVALRHVKPHGALYNRSARDGAVAAAIARGVRRVSADAVLVGLARSLSLAAARDAGLRVAAEAFADRAYEPDGSLRSRRFPDSMIGDPAAAARQAVSIARDRCVTAIDGTVIAIDADTICVHGDEPGATDRARAVRDALESAGVKVAALAS